MLIPIAVSKSYGRKTIFLFILSLLSVDGRPDKGREHILGTGVHHQEKLGEQVIEKSRIQLHIVAEFRSELCLPVCRRIRRVGRAVVGYLRCQRTACGLRRVCGFNPGGKLRQLGGIGIRRIGVRETGFKVIQPVIPGVIVRFPEHAVAGVVLHFPGLIPADKAEDFLRALVIVEVVLAQEDGGIVYRVMPENDDGETVDALANPAVRHLRRGLVRAGIVVQDRQLHVVGTFGGRHVRFHAEGVCRHRGAPQLVDLLGITIGIDNAALEFQLVVLPLIILRRSTLDIRLAAREGEGL